MDPFLTMDNSPTLYSEEYQEYYHSKSGAAEEVVVKYVKPCRIRELAKTGRLRILDVGFGIGYTIAATIDAALEENPNCEIEMISFEKDETVFQKIKDLNPPFKCYKFLKAMEFDPKLRQYLYEDSHVYIKAKLGDARETIKKVTGRFDAIYHDPFSPTRNRELWTLEFFKELHSRMKKDAILATYSYARSVRDNLKSAGFLVYDGPIVGRRSPSTLAKAC